MTGCPEKGINRQDRVGGVISPMTDPSSEHNFLAANLAASKAAKRPIGSAVALKISPTAFPHRPSNKLVSSVPAESGPQLIFQISHPAGILVEIMVSQALTVILAALVVAAILH